MFTPSAPMLRKSGPTLRSAGNTYKSTGGNNTYTDVVLPSNIEEGDYIIIYTNGGATMVDPTESAKWAYMISQLSTGVPYPCVTAARLKICESGDAGKTVRMENVGNERDYGIFAFTNPNKTDVSALPWTWTFNAFDNSFVTTSTVSSITVSTNDTYNNSNNPVYGPGYLKVSIVTCYGQTGVTPTIGYSGPGTFRNTSSVYWASAVGLAYELNSTNTVNYSFSGPSNGSSFSVLSFYLI